MRSDRILIRILTGIAIIGLAGCAATSGSTAASPARNEPASGRAATSALSGWRDAWLVVGRRGQPGLEVILASTAERDYELPNAVADETWGHLISADPDGTRTTIKYLIVQPGFDGTQTTIEGAWRLPTIGLDPTPVGVSVGAENWLNSATVVLVEDRAADAPRASTRLAILRHTPVGEPVSKVIELAGSFEYDAISPEGSKLYVVEHLPGAVEGRYQVRLVDVATGVLQEAIVADKRNLEEAMAGWPIAQVRRPDGLVLTLYRGPEHPFIHALNTREGWAVCIDLPAVRAHDAAAALDWGLAAAPDGRAIFAVNSTLGLAVDVDPGELSVRRTVAVQPLAAGSIVLAKFGHQDAGPAGRRVVVAPDGRTIYAAGAAGILAIDATRLAETHRYLEGTAVASLGLNLDGRTIFALDAASGSIVGLDAASGAVLGRVPADGFDRLLAVVPL